MPRILELSSGRLLKLDEEGTQRFEEALERGWPRIPVQVAGRREIITIGQVAAFWDEAEEAPTDAPPASVSPPTPEPRGWLRDLIQRLGL